ncbi:uncharacterized protein L969DRAFT_23937 [Mixia osmundae IAM 14324]|uniref:Arf-GAP domain-containing protein n=1 Tax=Mixia osmundae (strain CBS 9802 / IAM 14324 / JCM 22182 / KY 12970) TaxID=764103 RepID=G7E0V5_MIXOS|nr:uncharacterized protein L969DRAFT_23937 [Mixia osmundae IAM 14324]KEI39495.1 hypothetical protein L969DRAFT_23937 [Mixia osmundae IAM 14324]GAA96465.1 hypothetical protein E5Q_03132 [Mixia osmundae IAM 14324]
MAEYDAKGLLLDLMKQDGNKLCCDCKAPMPQWASVSHGTYICLNCSGVHRSLGVHISFVRSLTMDKWSEAQVRKMTIGGNAKARQFFEASPEYQPGMSIFDLYNSHVALQYRDKLQAECDGKEWDPSMTPAVVPSLQASSAVRKSRTLGASSALGSSGRNSPRSFGVSPSESAVSTPGSISAGAAGGIANPYSAKAKNESYFATLGAANSSRPEDLPPSQGGRYAGFGSGGVSPGGANATSSKALPSIDDFTQDPVSALSRGWGFFSSALGQAAKTVNETVIEPGMQRVADPEFQAQLHGYASKATTVLGEAGRRGGETLAGGMRAGATIAKREIGVDVGDLGASYVDKLAKRNAQQGGAASPGQQEAGLDFFDQHTAPNGQAGELGYSTKDIYAQSGRNGYQAVNSVVGQDMARGYSDSGSSEQATPDLRGKRAPAAKANKVDDSDWGNFQDDWKDD